MKGTVKVTIFSRTDGSPRFVKIDNLQLHLFIFLKQYNRDIN